MRELLKKMTETIKKCREIEENDPELQKIRQKLTEDEAQKEDFGNFEGNFNLSDTTSLRLTPELITKLGQFVGKSNRYDSKSALVRSILSKFFNENDELSTRFRSFFQ